MLDCPAASQTSPTRTLSSLISFFPRMVMTLGSVEALIAEVGKFSNVRDVSLRGLSTRRAQVWPGGLSILAELISVRRLGDDTP